MKLAELEQANRDLHFENEQLVNMNQHLHHVIQQNGAYQESQLRSLQKDKDYWKKLALKRDIEIQTLKMSQFNQSQYQQSFVESTQPHGSQFIQFKEGSKVDEAGADGHVSNENQDAPEPNEGSQR